jgi:hypothetical protein
MTLIECNNAMLAKQLVTLDGKGFGGMVANLTKQGKVQLRWPGDRRPRVGVDPSRVALADN